MPDISQNAPKKTTDSAQEQHRGKGCQHLNVEPIAWQTHTRTMLSSSSPTTLTWGLIRRATTPNKEKPTRMWRTGENTSIKGGGISLWRGRCPQGKILADTVTHGGGWDATRTKSEEIDLSNPIHVRFGPTGQIHLRMGFHENPDQTPARRPMAGLSKPTLYKSYCSGPLHTSPKSSLGRKNRVPTTNII